MAAFPAIPFADEEDDDEEDDDEDDDDECLLPEASLLIPSLVFKFLNITNPMKQIPIKINKVVNSFFIYIIQIYFFSKYFTIFTLHVLLIFLL